MPERFHATRLVEFCETDAAGIAHFTAFFQYMEQAEHAFLRHLGLSVLMKDGEGMISWPRVAANCDFDSPVRFEDAVDIELTIAKLGKTSVKYQFTFTSGERPIATGTLTVVCCRLATNQPPHSIPIPEEIGAKLEPFLIH
jgi:acyl-CoA thioester hydrolase